MHKLNKNTSIPDVYQTCETLTRHNQRLGICIDYDKLLTYYNHYLILAVQTRRRLERFFNWVDVEPLRGDKLIGLLNRKFGVYEGLTTTDGGSLSASAESLQGAIDTGIYSKEAVEVMKVAQTMLNAEYTVNALRRYTLLEPVNIPTFDGHRMIIIRPEWVPQNTNRCACREYAVQNITRILQDIFTVPKGWVMWYTDSSQIEPRTIYSAYLVDKQIQALINLYNDAYFGLLHYVNMPVEDIVSGTVTFEAHEITEQMRDMRQGFKRIGNGVVYGKTTNPGNDPLLKNYINRIGRHPARIAWEQEVIKAVDMGQTVFPTYFGTPIDITKGPSEAVYAARGKEALRKHHIRCAINNPIQGTAADLMRYSVRAADSYLARHAPNSVIMMYVHDSGRFAIYEDEYDKVKDFMKDIVAYDVEGWIPIYSDGELGRHEEGALFQDVF